MTTETAREIANPSFERNVLEVLDAMKRELNLLAWHVTQTRDNQSAEEIAERHYELDRALRKLRQSI